MGIWLPFTGITSLLYVLGSSMSCLDFIPIIKCSNLLQFITKVVVKVDYYCG
jgi:hypothetical protein